MNRQYPALSVRSNARAPQTGRSLSVSLLLLTHSANKANARKCLTTLHPGCTAHLGMPGDAAAHGQGPNAALGSADATRQPGLTGRRPEHRARGAGCRRAAAARHRPNPQRGWSTGAGRGQGFTHRADDHGAAAAQLTPHTTTETHLSCYNVGVTEGFYIKFENTKRKLKIKQWSSKVYKTLEKGKFGKPCV